MNTSPTYEELEQKVRQLEKEISLFRKAEEAFKSGDGEIFFLLENITDVLWTVDKDFKTTYISPSVEKVLGFTPEERMSQSFEETVTPESLRNVQLQFMEELARDELGEADHERSVTIDIEYYRKDGSTIWMENCVKAIRDDGGAIVGMYGISRDLTARRFFQEKSLEYERQIQNFRRAKSLENMAGAIAHHFNNLLGAVTGNLELFVLDSNINSASMTFIDRAIKATIKASELSNLLLSYLGHNAEEKEEIDLSEACRNTLSHLSVTFPDNICIKTSFPDYGPVVHANNSQIRTVITTLLNNSVEAISGNKGNISVAINTVKAEDIPLYNVYPFEWKPLLTGTYACLEVMDTGHGMDQKTIESLFDPFFSTNPHARGGHNEG